MNQNLGITAVDKVTGFCGTITGFAQYLTGCNQYLLVPDCEDINKYPAGHWFDVNRLEFVPAIKKVEIDTEEHKGADLLAPKY